DVLFVSSNAWDALGATWFGFCTLWINRQGLPPEAMGPAPHHTGRDLGEVLKVLGLH
ncbi:MAG: haloacid dehalogenase, partial [Limnohabitans sp.]|nr:haloacid dehalogenase [Limnohabitans sp.]